jgi:hypothetical protein
VGRGGMGRVGRGLLRRLAGSAGGVSVGDWGEGRGGMVRVWGGGCFGGWLRTRRER